MAKAFWKGVISFGMVVIPVRMYVAAESKTPSFHYLHNKCLTRPKQILYCETDDEQFSSRETVRGYEYAKGQFVVLKENDFQKIPVRTTHAIEILGFVDSREIDPIYYKGSHYLEPDRLGVKPFVMLREALVKTERVGIAKVTFQGREHLCCLRPADGILVLHTMHFSDEILPWNELIPPGQDISNEELEMAISLVNTMVKSFKPEDYRDEYRLALDKLIEAKVRGEEIKVIKAPKVEVTDLMSALKASIEAAKKKSALEEIESGAAAGIQSK